MATENRLTLDVEFEASIEVTKASTSTTSPEEE